ncbi:neutral zinc metallopeptidase [Nocardia sp. NPDC052254]|uniref:neutral zinc metallopeptidase n=1 Tax=Nocardia sp. NPDC052254 TaxID=3155681 RepID=UPI0034215492
MYGDRWYVYLAVFAHEYGHHVQAISGISQKSSRDRYNAGVSSATGLELSRRLELEAQCFGGMFFGSSLFVGTITNDQGYFVKQDNYDRGDDHSDVRDHGANQHYGAWYAQGEEHNRTWMCNTWNSPSDAVS